MCFFGQFTSPEKKLTCVYWRISAWIEDGCHVSETNSTHTVCSCEHLSTFALIMTVDQTLEVRYFMLQLRIFLYLSYMPKEHSLSQDQH